MQKPIPNQVFLAKICAVLAGMASLGGIATSPAIAEITILAQFQPPPMSSPGNREAGGQRNDTCADTTDSVGLVALVPETNIGLTTQASPDLFAYVPPNNAEFAELRIFKESTGEEVYAGQVSLPESEAGAEYRYQSGIIQIPLSTTTVTLEPNENYLWGLFVVCNSANRAEDIVVDVVVQRVGDDYLSTLPADLTKQLETVDAISGEEKITVYGSAGIWHDLLTEVFTLSEAEPEQYSTVWADLLVSQGMDEVVEMPVYTASLETQTP